MATDVFIRRLVDELNGLYLPRRLSPAVAFDRLLIFTLGHG